MGDSGFAFNEVDFSDRVLRIETIEAEADDAVKVTTLNISSSILSSQSACFHKLLENGMEESHLRAVTLKINVHEEAALIDLLNFMYINVLSATTVADLRAVLMVSDKFEVTSCTRYCIQKLPTPPEFELCYRDPLNAYVSTSEAAEPLQDAAKKYLIAHFRNLTERFEEAMALPLSALEVVLGSNGLQVNSEEDVFDFILRWGRAHYPKLEDRQEILTKRLARLICLPNVSLLKLKREMPTCPDFDRREFDKLGIDRILCRARLPIEQKLLVTCDTPATSRLIERVYTHHPVNVEYIESSAKRCVVYFSLTKGEVSNLLQSKQLYSKPFFLGRHLWHFSLSARCSRDRRTSLDHFGLFLYWPTHPKGPKKLAFALDYEFSVSNKPSKEFVTTQRVKNCRLKMGNFIGEDNLFDIPWSDFMADESEYFIDDVLYLEAKFAINHTKNRPTNIVSKMLRNLAIDPKLDD